MISFRTIVILDLETTGLPHLEHKLTKITEISLVACVISHCQGGELPRVINKLTLALNPMKMILPQTSKITGLENEMLEEMKTFDDNVVSMLNGFLERLPQPVCLVAHNGLKFDFPILLRQIQKCKIKLIDNIYCADSLPAFRVILNKSVNLQSKTIHKSVHPSMISESTVAIKSDDAESTKRRMSCETTPERRTMHYNAQPMKASIHSVTTEHSKVSRKLNFDNDIQVYKCYSKYLGHSLNSNPSQTHNSDCLIANETQINQKLLKSYKLIDIYSYLHDEQTPIFHRSEDDCMALLSCINKCKDAFINWLHNNAMPLENVKPLF